MRTMTAVEWLVAHLYAEGITIRKELVDEAIEREKKQTQDVFNMSKSFNNPINYNNNEETTNNAPSGRDGMDSTSTV